MALMIIHNSIDHIYKVVGFRDQLTLKYSHKGFGSFSYKNHCIVALPVR